MAPIDKTQYPRPKVEPK